MFLRGSLRKVADFESLCDSGSKSMGMRMLEGAGLLASELGVIEGQTEYA